MTARASILIPALLLSACSTHSLQELRQTPPSGTPFQSTLALRYLAFAEQEEKEYDWFDSWHFADKGLRLAYGNDAEPERPESRDLDAKTLQTLQDARAELVAKLTDAGKQAKPEDAANAQFFYDCWVEQQEEGWQDEQIEYCRDNFYESLRALSGPASETTPLLSEPDADAPPAQVAYLVYFGWNRPELDEAAERTVNEIAKSLKGMADFEVVLNGHTDSSGPALYNMTLSQARAQRVKSALIARGINPKRIKTFGFGETDPRVPTPDATDEPQNRRVEIFVN